MDTKWNNTTEIAAETMMPRKKKSGLRAAAAFLAFFLGVSLTLGSLGSVIGRWAVESDCAEWWQNDWQETPVFRASISHYLERFLSIGVGRNLDWYVNEDYSVDIEYSEYGSGMSWFYSDTPIVYRDSASTDTADESSSSPDFYYRNDLNILYSIQAIDGKQYSNLENVTSEREALSSYEKLPNGYNFLLIYDDGRVSIWKDGEKLSVYDSDNILDENSLWNVPGYDNFKADEDAEHAVVQIAVRQTPIRYIGTDGSSYSYYSSIHRIYQSIQRSQKAWRSITISLSVGLVLLAAWFLLRKEQAEANRAIAKVTAYIPTELRFLAVFLCLIGLIYPMLAMTNRYSWWDFSKITVQVLRCIGAGISNLGALLGVVWSAWFIHNDHRYNSREKRRSIYRMVSGAMRRKELRYPIQKRFNRRTAVRTVLIILSVISSLALFYIYVTTYEEAVLLGIVAVWLLLGLLPSILGGRRERELARDFGRLADQVTAIQGGELTTPLDLPEDADLRETAEHLNSIQMGLKAAVAEQTRSERMKVELISNVSHDLKTPLTSILSYSELLMQEPLEGAAADYAQIIQQKAVRLKSMVQDEFEVSKAVSDQLPVKLETLDFGKLLRQTLADMDGEIQKSGLIFKLDLPEQPVEIVADGSRLYRVFQNLIQNALNYSLPGSRVHLTLKTVDRTAAASIRNTSRNELPEGVDLTERFVRGDESRTDGGTGLGLSVAKSFTEACGGTFRVETVADLFAAIVAFPLAETK